MNEDKLKKAYESASKHYDMPDFNTFKADMKDEAKLKKFRESLSKHYSVPDYETFKADMGVSKKKEPTVSPSGSDPKKSSSVTQPKKTSGQSASSFKVQSEEQLGDGSTQKIIRGDAGKGERNYALRISPDGRQNWYEYSHSGNPQKGDTKDYYDKPITDPTRVSTLNRKFGFKASTDTSTDTYTGFPGKEDNEYRVSKLQNGQEVWEVRRKGQSEFTTIANAGSINALNREYNKSVSPTTDASKKRDAQIARSKSAEEFKIITGEVMGMEEEAVVEALRRTYGDKGFTFNETGKGDAIDVIVNDGSGRRATFYLDNWSDDTDRSEALKLRKFLQENQQLGDYVDLEKEQELKTRDAYVDLTQADLKRQQDRLMSASSQAEFEKAQKDNSNEFTVKEMQKVSQDAKDLREEIVRGEYNSQQRIADITKTASTEKEKEELAAIAKANQDGFVDRYKINDNYVNDLAKTSKTVNDEFKSLNDEIEAFNSNYSNLSEEEAEIKKAEFEARYNELVQKDKDIRSEISKVDVIEAQNQKDAALYLAYNETRGSVAGGLLNSAIKGVFGVLGEENAEGLAKILGSEMTTDEFMQSDDRWDITKAAFSVAESTGALAASILTGGAAKAGQVGKLGVEVAKTMPFFSMSYNEIKSEMNTSEFKGVSNWQKEGLAILYGLGVGYLDRVSTQFGVEGVPANIAKNTIFRAISGLQKGATTDAIEAAITAQFKKDISAGLIKIAGGSLVEGTTEGAQSLYGSGLKAGFNWIKGEDKFNVDNWAKDATYEAYMGALGGLVMSVPSGAVRGIKNGFNRMSPEYVELSKKVIEDSNLRSMVITDIKTKLMTGKITKEDAQEQIQAIKDASGLFGKMPDNLSPEATAQSMDLIIERSKIEKEISGKEDNLVVAQKERIKEINTELQNISKDAVQKQTTDEGVLQPEGSEVGLQEVEQGDTKQEVVTEEGKEEAVAVESNDAKVYSTALEEAKAEMGKKGPGLDLQVSSVSEQEAQEIVDEGGKVFMTEDGLAGAYVKKDGYMGGLFKSPKSTFKDVAKVLQAARIKAGGYFMDAYATKLEDIYVKNGFRPVARLKFNEEYAPEGWNAEGSPLKNKPDVVFFTYDPEGTYSVGDGQVFDDYDAAYEFTKSQKLTQQPVTQNEVTLENFAELEAQAAQNNDSERIKTLRAARMVTKALKGVKVFIHNSPEEYQQALANASGTPLQVIIDEENEVDEDGVVQRSAGQYVNGEIHIDGTIGSARTVYHEAFHDAILKSGLAVDMARGLSKIISDKNLRAQINEFVSRYKDAEQNEEMIAELGAIMAEAEVELTTTKFQQFKQLINKLAQKLGLPAILPAAADRQQVVDFINSMSRGLREGREVSAKYNENPINDLRKKNLFGSEKTKVEVVYIENDRADQLIKDGLLSEIEDISDIDGMYAATTSPDDMFVGEIYVNGELKAEGFGGVFFVTKFGDVWASSNKSVADQIAIRINRSRERNNGKGYLLLVKGSDSKLISSPQGASSSLKVVEALVQDGLVSSSDFRRAVNAAMKENPDTKAKINLTGSMSASDMISAVDSLFDDVKKSSFDNRGTILRSIIVELGNTDSIKTNSQKILKFLGGDPNKSLGWSKTSKTNKTSQSAVDLIAGVSREIVTKGLENGSIYAAIEVDQDVEVVKDKHGSYPFHIRKKDGSKPKLILMKNREHGRNSMVSEKGESVDDLGKSFDGKVLGTASNGYGEGMISVRRQKQLAPKKSKQSPNSQAVNKAKEKYDLSIERGNSTAQARESAINDLKKSDWYVNADDISREDAVRELRSKLGLKEKKAPSVAKITGKPKDKKVIVNDRTARNTQLRLEAKAARESQMDLKQKQRALIVAVNQMKRGGLITVNQASALAKRLAYVNVDNPIMVERFLQYADRLFDRADYQERLREARKVKARVNKLRKSGDAAAHTIALGKLLSNIDPELVEDIDMFIEVANEIKDALEPSRVIGEAASIRLAARISKISDYAKSEIKRQEEILKQEKLAEYEDLVEAGVISDKMTLKEIKAIISEINNPSIDPDVRAQKEEEVRNYIESVINSHLDNVNFLLENNIDPSGIRNEMTERQRSLISELLRIDVSQIGVRDLMKMSELMDNFVKNGIVDGIEEFSKSNIGKENAIKVEEDGTKARSMHTFGNKTKLVDEKIGTEGRRISNGRFWGQQMMSFKVLNDLMFKGVGAASRVLDMMGFSDFENGVARATRMWNDILDSYTDKFQKTKPNGKDFNDAYNIYERGMYAALKRTIIGNKSDVDIEMKRMVSIINESIKRLARDGDAKQKETAKIYAEIADKLGINEDGVTMLDIESRIDPNNRNAVNWWIDEWSKHYSDLSDVSESVYNTILGQDMFYTPYGYAKIKGTSMTIDEILNDNSGAFASTLDYIYDDKSGSLKEAVRPNGMADGRYLNLDFDTVNSKSLKAALVDINTASATRQIKGFLSSDSWKNIIEDVHDRDMYEAKLKAYIFRSRNKMPGVQDKDSALDFLSKISNMVGFYGTARALATTTQSVKQTVPLILSTMINTRGNIKILNPFADKDAYDFIHKSGYGIANRGQESATSIETAHRAFNKTSKGFVGGTKNAFKFVEGANQMWLKMFLSRPDVWVAKSAWLSYYKHSLKRQGIDTSNIDWSTHKINKEAGNYAQHMVDRQQFVSDVNLAGEFFIAESPYVRIFRNILMPFSSFSTNQKSRVFADISTAFNGSASNQDRGDAAVSLAGLSVEMITMFAIRYYISVGMLELAKQLIGGDLDDEDEEKMKERAFKNAAKQIVLDIMSPNASADYFMVNGMNKLISWWSTPNEDEISAAIKEENEIREKEGKEPLSGEMKDTFVEKFMKVKREENLIWNEGGINLGVYSIGSDQMKEFEKLVKIVNTGVYEKEYGGIKTEKFLMPEDRKPFKVLLPFVGASMTGFLPGDPVSLYRSMMKVADKKAISASKRKTFEAIKGDDNKISEIEKFLMGKFKTSETSTAAEKIIEEIDWIERNGGLQNQKQMDKYIEIFERDGSVGSTDLQKIQKLK